MTAVLVLPKIQFHPVRRKSSLKIFYFRNFRDPRCVRPYIIRHGWRRIIVSVWLNPSVSDDKNLDHQILFDIHRKATTSAIKKAMQDEPSIDWLLENQDKIIHKYFEKALKEK